MKRTTYYALLCSIPFIAFVVMVVVLNVKTHSGPQSVSAPALADVKMQADEAMVESKLDKLAIDVHELREREYRVVHCYKGVEYVEFYHGASVAYNRRTNKIIHCHRKD